MKQALPKRLAIIGLPGSGKSTFAVRLGKMLNLPVHHLDKYVFDGRKKRDRQAFLAFKEALISEDSWIIEGCSLSTLEMRVARADTVIYFHLPRLLCLWRIGKRLFTFDSNLSETGCLRGVNWTLIRYTWNFDREKRASIEELKKKYPHVRFLIFRSSKEAENYLENLKGR